MGELWGRVASYLRFQLRLKMLCLTHRDWKVIVFTPWLPPVWTVQWLYLLYRWVLALYFSAWLLYNAIECDGCAFAVYLTNWGFVVWVAYLLSAAIAVTINFVRAMTRNQVLYFPRRHLLASAAESDTRDGGACRGCCPRGLIDNTNCCDKITWFLFIIGAEAAVLIAVLFWTTQYNTEGATNVVSIHLHLVNAVVALIDLWVSGVPVFLLHFVYFQLFGAVYVGFTGMYYAFENNTAIYQVLDYQSNPGLATGLAVGVVVLGMAVIHLLFLVQYLCRRAATARLFRKYNEKFHLSLGTSTTPSATIARQRSVSPPPSISTASSPSVAPSITTPILLHHNKQLSTHSSQESFF